MNDNQAQKTFSYIPDKTVKIIFDTDMDTDVDDTGALAVLYSYVQEGRAEVLATVGSCNSGCAVKCIGGINAYYGFPEVPVGISPHCPSSGKSPYQSIIAEKYGKDYPDDKTARSALEVYREVLSSAEDNSVVITVIGALNNLCDLLKSESDKYSPLNGTDLVRQKVKLCIIMGGRFPKSAPVGEYNIRLDVNAAYYVVHSCPVSILWSGQEIGGSVFTGNMRNEMESDNPVRLAYDLYGNDETGAYTRESWDLTTIVCAVEGAKDYWDIQTGSIEINTEEKILVPDYGPAYNNWTACEGKDAILIQKMNPEKIAEMLNKRMVTAHKEQKAKEVSYAPVSTPAPKLQKQLAKKIGLFLDEIQNRDIDDNEKFSKLGFNTGNMLFWHALKTQLNLDVKSRWYIDHIDRLNLEDYNAFVTTDLIWIRQMQDFSYLNKVLDVIGTLPLVPISIGLQCNSYLPDFKMHPETVKLIQRISERCTMGVRGAYTAEILNKYGIKNFKVIGCPSMYMDAAGIETVSNRSKPINNVSVNFETFYGKLSPSKIDFLQYCAEHGFEFVEQTQANIDHKHIPDAEKLQQIQNWISSKKHCFFDINQWREYIRKFDFSMGTRFHGNVLALWENVPSLFLTCDSRTKELCEHFSLPHIDISEFDAKKPIEYYYEKADYSELHKQYPQRLKEWKEFLETNRLSDKLQVNNSNKRQTVVYHAANAGCFVKCLLHKCIYHHDDDAFFIGYSWLEDRFGTPDRYQKNISYYPIVGPAGQNRYNHGSSEEAFSKIKLVFDDLLDQNNIDLKKIDKIYIGSYYADFAIYVNYKKIRHSIFEEAEGNWYKLYFDGFDTANKLFEEFNMSMYNNEYVENRYGVFSKWPLDNKTQKDVNFEAYNEIYKLSNEDKQYIREFFNIPVTFETKSKYNVLLLTQWFEINRIKLESSEVIFMYRIILDYFIPQEQEDVHIFIKPHPADPACDDYNVIENISIISPSVMSELMGLIENIHFNFALTVSSSSIFSVKAFTDSSRSIGYNIAYHYHKLNRLYFIFNQIIPFTNYKTMYRYGITDDTYQMLEKSDFIPNNIAWHDLSSAGKSFIVIDLLKWSDKSVLIDTKTIDTDTICFFLNLNEINYSSVSNLPDLLDNSIFFELIEYEKNDLTLAENQHMCCFCKNRNILEQLKLFTGSHFFKYQNKFVICSALTDIKADIIRLKIYNNLLSDKKNKNNA